MAMGGVGEAMLLGAAMGGGSAALTGGDPLKGALLGGLTGGVGSGISGALSGAGAVGTEAALATAGTELGTQAATQAAVPTAAVSAPSMMGGQTATQQFMGSMNPATAGGAALPGNMGTIAPGVGSFAPTGGISNLPATGGTFSEGMARFAGDPMASIMSNKGLAAGSALAGMRGGMEGPEDPEEYNGPLKRFRFSPETYRAAPFAEGGITTLASGGYDRMVGEEPMYPSNMASGGISSLGSYSDGGRMLKGPGDGMSDSIPGVIGGKRPARLADGEFVVPADVVSHLGNGSTDAGAKQLYSMMDKVRKARTGSKKQGREINPRKYALA